MDLATMSLYIEEDAEYVCQTAPPPVHGGGTHHRVEPGAEGSLAPKGVDRAKSPDESLLSQVVGVGPVTTEGVGKTPNRGDVGPNQSFKRGRVASLGTL